VSLGKIQKRLDYSIFDYAVKIGMLADNPCRCVIVPKGEKKEKQVYSIDVTTVSAALGRSQTSTTLNYLLPLFPSGAGKNE